MVQLYNIKFTITTESLIYSALCALSTVLSTLVSRWSVSWRQRGVTVQPAGVNDCTDTGSLLVFSVTNREDMEQLGTPRVISEPVHLQYF